MSKSIFKNLGKYAEEWKSGGSQSSDRQVSVRNYPELFKLKYEVLCVRFNELNNQ